MTRLFTFLIMLALFLPAFADESRPLFYSRETLTIQRKPEVLPWQQDQQPQPISGITFDVEVRDAQSFYNQKDWFNLSGPTDDSGVLLVFAQAGKFPIIASKQYAPLDILFIDPQGHITQVVPNILLSSLAQQIMPQNPVLAFLFLKGGTCQNLNIKPGDTIDYKIFNKLPIVLGEPVAIVDSPQPTMPLSDLPKKPTKPLLVPHNNSRPIPPLPPLPSAMDPTHGR